MAFTVPGVGENQVRAAPMSGERLRAADFSGGETIGRAVAGFGQDVQKFAADQDQIQQHYDTVAVKTMETKALEELAPIRNSVLTAQGIDAAGAKVKGREQVNELYKKYATTLSTPRQRAMFEDAFSRIRMGEFEAYDGHEAKETSKALTAASSARVSANFDRAVGLRATPELSKAALADALGEIKNANPGMPPEVIAQKGRDIVTAYRLTVANAIKDQDGDVLGAEAYVKQHAGEINDAEETAWWRGSRDAIDEEHADSYYGEALAVASGVERVDPNATRGDQETVAAANADPVRGKGKPVSSAAVLTGRGTPTSGFNDSRPGGRQHAAQDYAAPAGTPVHPPMSGKVIKKWFDKEGGNSVLIEHPDGRVTGYAHLRNINVDQGDTVDANTVIGGVGNTGSGSHGNHLHFTVRVGGRRVDPQTQKWVEGEGTHAPRSGPTDDRVDLQRQYRAIEIVAQRHNLSRKQTDALYARADRDASRNDRLRDRAQEDAAEAVDKRIDEIESSGGEFTSLKQLGGLEANLKPSQRLTIRALADRNAKGEEVKDGESSTWADLYELSGNAQTQDQFARMDLKPLRGSMSKGEYKELVRTQVDLRNGKKDPSKNVAVEYGRIDTMVGRFAPQSVGLVGRNAKEREQAKILRGQVTATIRAQVAAAQERKGQQLTDDELAGVVRRNLAVVHQNDDASVTMPRGAATGQIAVKVPGAERDKIIAALRRARPGARITEGLIAQLYLENGGGIK